MLRLRLFFRRLSNMLFGRNTTIDASTLQLLESMVETYYGVDLNQPQHGHDEVRLKRFFVSFILNHTGWSVMELHRQMEAAGIKARGLSRRSLQYLWQTHEAEMTSDNIGEAYAYATEYKNFTNKLNSIL